MASFSIEDFVGDGVLKELIPKLLEEGWDDVPTLKIMNPEDMDAINMTQHQKDALEIRTYLHDRALMQYGDKLEASRKSLPELLNLSTEDLSSQFGMKGATLHVSQIETINAPILYPNLMASLQGNSQLHHLEVTPFIRCKP